MDADPRTIATSSPARTPASGLPGIPAMRGWRPDPIAQVTVRYMDPAHLPFVVQQHRQHFPDGFFARLGPRFLAAYTRTYLTSPHALAFIAEIGEQPAGFLVGITDPALHRRHLLRTHGISLAVRGFLSLVVRPGLAVHFLRTRLPLYYRRLRTNRSPQPALNTAAMPGTVAVLTHVAVAEPARSLGIGTELIERFVANAAIAGSENVVLVTAAGHEGAGPYYERLGWKLRGAVRTPEGRQLLTYGRKTAAPVTPASDHSAG